MKTNDLLIITGLVGAGAVAYFYFLYPKPTAQVQFEVAADPSPGDSPIQHTATLLVDGFPVAISQEGIASVTPGHHTFSLNLVIVFAHGIFDGTATGEFDAVEGQIAHVTITSIDWNYTATG